MEKTDQVAVYGDSDRGRSDADGLHGGEQEGEPTTDGPREILGHPGWQDNGFGRGDQVERRLNEEIINGIYHPGRNDGIRIRRRTSNRKWRRPRSTRRTVGRVPRHSC